MLIPKYLEGISEIVNASKNIEEVRIKCKCGHSNFFVYEFTDANNVNFKPCFSEIMRENDKLYYVKRNFFGKIVKKIECENMSLKKQRKIIKVKCEKCGQDYILFDNYKHGYEAAITKQENLTSEKEIEFNFKKIYSQPIEVYVKIYQDISYNEFKEEFENMDYTAYLNSFSNIDIYGKNSKLRKIKICSEETA